MTAKVNTRSASSQSQWDKLRLPKALMGGTEAMRVASAENRNVKQTNTGETITSATDYLTAYLPQFPKESNDAYFERLARTFLFPAYAEAVCGIVDKVFAKELTLSDEASDLAKKIAEDCDREGRDLHNFAADLFELAVDQGHSFIVVDMPVMQDAEEPRTLDMDIAERRYPYFQFLSKANVIAWRVDEFGLSHIRFYESVTEQEGEWGEKQITQIKVLERGYWAIYRKGEGEDGEFQLYDEGQTTLFMLPVIPVYTGRTGILESEPPFYELAQLNVKHWQLESDLRNIEHVTCFPVWSFLGFDDEKSGERAFGPSIAVQSDNPQAKVDVTEPGGSSIQHVKDSIIELKREMEMLARKPLMPREGTQTATEARNQQNQADTPIKRWALALKDALEMAFFIAHQWMGEEAATEVMVNTEFQPMHNLEDLKVLGEWEARGSLSRETLWKEAKRRNVLDREFDAEAEAEAIAEAAPDFAQTTPGDDAFNAYLERQMNG